jgi:hypothetical protein
VLSRVAVVIVVSIAIIVVGCSDSEQPLDVYLFALDIAEDNAQFELDAASAEYNSAIAEAQSDVQIVAAFNNVLNDIGAITGRAYGEIRGIAPPPEVEQLHNEALRAQAEVIELLLDLQLRAEQAESNSEVEALLLEMESGPEFSAVRQRMQEAVCAIQAIGEANGSDVEDIGCEQ